MSLLRLELQSKLQAQGRGSSKDSALSKSLEYEIKASANVLIASMYANEYWVYVENGVKASRIPYSRGPKRGGTSKYIQALIKFFRFKVGKSEKKATRLAFATANKHKKEGMPTRASFRFSRDGTRTGFVESTLKKHEDKVTEILERKFGSEYEIALTNTLQEAFALLGAE